MTSGHLSYEAAREHNADLMRSAQRERRLRPARVSGQRRHRVTPNSGAAIRVWWQDDTDHAGVPTR